ncbi:hypothetical protein Aca07nite_00360 [Actinoplanes capillaceus]|uniref:Uncharacterized protein n=1 Tax=Actinoplanes campanulatus TaxID=113559 RepID=A0ABQ3WA71_9ACTN|nr:hypothetical protein [Actinoplanes capillaceus]GID42761.1 hypothetical protein Aca07nite_00360 [Actinoplanes capillaceus]
MKRIARIWAAAALAMAAGVSLSPAAASADPAGRTVQKEASVSASSPCWDKYHGDRCRDYYGDRYRDRRHDWYDNRRHNWYDNRRHYRYDKHRHDWYDNRCRDHYSKGCQIF